ncbi:MAG: bacteriocin family protein [Synergistaceae bacterium]|nr:bacteriocin family protein [Synergistaceae bacterium]
MDMFGRELAPVSASALSEIDSQASRTLCANLAARRFLDVKGPYGWNLAASPSGRLEYLSEDSPVGVGVRTSQPLVEIRADFELSAFELHNVDRGCPNPDLVPVEKAAKAAAAFEDKAVFEGFEKAGIKGLKDGSENAVLELPKNDADGFVSGLVDYVGRLKRIESVAGPFALIGGRDLAAVLNKLVGGRTLLGALQKYTDVDEYIYTSNSSEIYLVSKRGGDFELTLGGDFLVGYAGREGDSLRFFLTESFTFSVLEPRAYSPVKLK